MAMTKRTEATPADVALAQRIRDAEAALNAVVREAHEAGIQVQYSIGIHVGPTPQLSEVHVTRIERPARWIEGDYPGVVL